MTVTGIRVIALDASPFHMLSDWFEKSKWRSLWENRYYNSSDILWHHFLITEIPPHYHRLILSFLARHFFNLGATSNRYIAISSLALVLKTAWNSSHSSISVSDCVIFSIVWKIPNHLSPCYCSSPRTTCHLTPRSFENFSHLSDLARNVGVISHLGSIWSQLSHVQYFILTWEMTILTDVFTHGVDCLTWVILRGIPQWYHTWAASDHHCQTSNILFWLGRWWLWRKIL